MYPFLRMDRVGTKDHVERETDEAERLVRPAPKVKPPRHDKRRERMDVEDDPDLDMTDKDLSKNYKTIGGSVAHRVLERWAKAKSPAAKKVRVRKKETGWVGWIGQDALKKSPGDYEVVEAEEDEGKGSAPAEEAKGEGEKPAASKGEKPSAETDAKAQASLREMAKSDAEFAAILKDFTNPKSDMFGWVKGDPEKPVAQFLRGRTPPKGIKTLGDLQRVLLLKAPKTKAPKKAPEVAPEAPKAEAPKAKKTPKAPKVGPVDPALAVGAYGDADEESVDEEGVDEDEGDADKPVSLAGGAGVPTRPVSRSEVQAAHRLIVNTFPSDVAATLLLNKPALHPDEINALVSDYHVASAVPLPLSKLEGFRANAAKFYTLDPNSGPDPKVVQDKEGATVSLASLSPEDRAVAVRKHRVRTVAMSLAAKAALSQGLVREGAPKELADSLSGFLLSGSDESMMDRQKRASKEAEALFYRSLEQEQVKPLAAGAVARLLTAVDDPAAKRVAVGYFQARDYQEARQRFLDHKSKEHISEHQAPDVIAARLSKASDFLRKRAERYPEGVSTQDTALTFQTRVLKHIAALVPDKLPLIQELLDEGDNAYYDKAVAKHKKAVRAYQMRRVLAEKEAKNAYDKYSEALKAGGDPNVEPPLGAAERLAAEGALEPVEPRRPPRYDIQRKKPADLKESATHLWDDFMSRTASQRIAARYLATPFSTYPVACAMGQNRQAVYWGVEPYPKGQGPSSYVGWEQPQARDLGDKDFTRILKAARVWLKTPVLATNIEGIVRDTQLRAALDLAIDTEGYASVLHPTLYNNLLARLAGEPQDETLLTVTAFAEDEIDRSTTARMTMPKDTVELKQAQADHFLARLDRMASTVQEKHEQWGMPLATAKEFVNGLDKLADEFEKAAYGEQSLTIRQASIVLGTEKTAEVIQRDSDEKYMDTFSNPQKPIQTEADEPYMAAYKSDDSSGVQNGSAGNGRKLAP